jgi:hypothetical protein
LFVIFIKLADEDFLGVEECDLPNGTGTNREASSATKKKAFLAGNDGGEERLPGSCFRGLLRRDLGFARGGESKEEEGQEACRPGKRVLFHGFTP